MKKRFLAFLIAGLCLCLAACGNEAAEAPADAAAADAAGSAAGALWVSPLCAAGAAADSAGVLPPHPARQTASSMASVSKRAVVRFISFPPVSFIILSAPQLGRRCAGAVIGGYSYYKTPCTYPQETIKSNIHHYMTLLNMWFSLNINIYI